MEENLKIIEGEIVHIYENSKGERLINARELHNALESKRQFANWMRQRIEHYKFAEYQDFFTFNKFVKRNQKDNLGNRIIEYYLTIDMAKELCMVENNEVGRKIRKYFIEVEKRYRSIVNTLQNIFDVMHLALNQIEEIEYKVIYERNTKNEKNGEVKEKGYKIENICYKVKI